MKIILLFILILHSLLAYPQNKTIDSLKKVLKTQKEDTTKVNTLNILASEFRYYNVDTGIYFVNRAIALATRLNYKIGIADSKSKLGALYASQAKYDEGVKSCNEAILLYETLLLSASVKEVVLKKMASAYFELGHNRIQQGNYPEALQNSLAALKISENLGDKKGIGDSEFNIGNIYALQINYAEALKHHLTALKISVELGAKADMAISYTTVGFIYAEQGNYAEASKYNSPAVRLAEETKDKLTLAEIYYNNLGVMNDKEGKYNEALRFYFAALKLYREVRVNEQIPFVYNSISSVYIKQKKYDDASKYLDKSLSVSKQLGNLEGIKLSYQNRAALDSAQEIEQAAKEINYDFDGVNRPQHDKDNYSVVYADFVPSLVKAVQELSKKVDERDKQISDLQSQVNDLKLLITKSASGASISSTGYLKQNAPNPFNSNTVISYYIPESTGHAQIKITDVKSRVIKIFNVAKGEGQINISSSSLAAGNYNYTLHVNDRIVETKQMILLK